MSKHTSLNLVIRMYHHMFRVFRDNWELSEIEERAFRYLDEAYARISEWSSADVEDLHLRDSVRIAHNTMKLTSPLPDFNPARRPAGWTPEQAAAVKARVSEKKQRRRERAALAELSIA